jgi:hypothetical protein
MSSRIGTDLNQHKVSLEKLLPKSKEENKPVENEERITDLLNVLMDFSMTIDLLRETNVGQILQDIKNNFPDSSIGNLAKKVIAKWRKDCKGGNGEEEKKRISVSEAEGVAGEKIPRATTQMVNIKKKVVPLSDSPPTIAGGGLLRAPSYDEDEWNEDHYERLSETRRKV